MKNLQIEIKWACIFSGVGLVWMVLEKLSGLHGKYIDYHLYLTNLFAIPAIRGIEFGTGFAAAGMFGVDHNDPILDETGKTKTNHAGGVVGGYTNGNDLVFRVAVKPTSSTPKDQITWNWETNEQEVFSVKGRHDLCIALRVPVVLEAVTAIVLADLMILEQKIPRILK
jgi:chorismate synthase